MPNPDDPYLYPGTDVLRNKLGLRELEAFTLAEYGLSYSRIGGLQGVHRAGDLDLQHLQAIHRHLFQDVYDWAGELRTVHIDKGGTAFGRPEYLESESRRIHESLVASDFLRGLEKTPFVTRFADVYADWNALHPFREGNGRALRELMQDLAHRAGYDFDYRPIANDRNGWYEASRRSVYGDMKPLEAVLDKAIRPSCARAFEELDQREALARHPELRGSFDTVRAMRDFAEHQFRNDDVLQARYVVAFRAKLQQALNDGKVLELSRTPGRAFEERLEPPTARSER